MLLRAVVRLAPAGMSISIYDGMQALPLFNPSLEAQMHATVQTLRDAVMNSDAVIIASPEYAHGVSGVMKNALDWLVSDERFVGKPVALLSSSPRSRYAEAALRETLVTMSARMIDAASVAVPVRGTGMDEEGILQHTEIACVLRAALIALAQAVTQPVVEGGRAMPQASRAAERTLRNAPRPSAPSRRTVAVGAGTLLNVKRTTDCSATPAAIE